METSVSTHFLVVRKPIHPAHRHLWVSRPLTGVLPHTCLLASSTEPGKGASQRKPDHSWQLRSPRQPNQKIKLEMMAYFSAAHGGLFFVHVYHAFHHVDTSKKPPLETRFSKKQPLKTPVKTQNPGHSGVPHFFLRQLVFFATPPYPESCLYKPSAE